VFSGSAVHGEFPMPSGKVFVRINIGDREGVDIGYWILDIRDLGSGWRSWFVLVPVLDLALRCVFSEKQLSRMGSDVGAISSPVVLCRWLGCVVGLWRLATALSGGRP
jgi:hypothetical protein